jgi:hypothetical protein
MISGATGALSVAGRWVSPQYGDVTRGSASVASRLAPERRIFCEEINDPVEVVRREGSSSSDSTLRAIRSGSSVIGATVTGWVHSLRATSLRTDKR